MATKAPYLALASVDVAGIDHARDAPSAADAGHAGEQAVSGADKRRHGERGGGACSSSAVFAGLEEERRAPTGPGPVLVGRRETLVREEVKMQAQQTPMDRSFAKVWEANGLLQQRQIDLGLAVLGGLAGSCDDPWTANIVRGTAHLRRAQILVEEAKQHLAAGRADRAEAAWESAESEALEARGDVDLVTMTPFGSMQDPWPDLVKEFVGYVQEERSQEYE